MIPIWIWPRVQLPVFRTIWRQPALLRPNILIPLAHGSRYFSDKSSESSLVCTIFDAKGNVRSASTRVPRRRLVRELGLHSRDLRHIEGPSAVVPRILVRGGSILVSITGLRVVIRKDMLYVFTGGDTAASERLQLLLYDLQTTLVGGSGDSSQVYEQRALETVLVHALAYLEVRLQLVLSSVTSILAQLEDNVERSMLKELLAGARQLDTFYAKAQAVKGALDAALDDDEGVAGMYLTPNMAGESDLHDVGLLLETYYSQADELVQKARLTARDVDATTEIVNMMIDTNRNQLMLFRLKTSIVTLAATASLFVADLYGMNLENGIDETVWGMSAVAGTALFVGAFSARMNLGQLATARRMHLTGLLPTGPTVNHAAIARSQAHTTHAHSWLRRQA